MWMTNTQFLEPSSHTASQDLHKQEAEVRRWSPDSSPGILMLTWYLIGWIPASLWIFKNCSASRYWVLHSLVSWMEVGWGSRIKGPGFWGCSIPSHNLSAQPGTPCHALQSKSGPCSPWVEALLLEIWVPDDRHLGSGYLFSKGFLWFSFANRVIMTIAFKSPGGFRKWLSLDTEGHSYICLLRSEAVEGLLTRWLLLNHADL